MAQGGAAGCHPAAAMRGMRRAPNCGRGSDEPRPLTTSSGGCTIYPSKARSLRSNAVQCCRHLRIWSAK